ncbi:ABC transporter ATP-binding protein [Schaalia sp. ZJ405]|uniref:ABC transporter ATP-binding protein n=1 Tax=Schaalia sp. ZJ405 TaxID=2709403 RepID=UPI001E2B97E5|nr:DUF2232 domain-containing protein [Schaalia sp. ZJ405]
MPARPSRPHLRSRNHATSAVTPTPVRKTAAALSPTDIATCGALASLAVTLGILATVITPFALFLQVGSAVPLAMIAVRLRPRATVAAVVTTLLMTMAVGGLSCVWTVAQSAIVGVIVGSLMRRGMRWPGIIVTGIVLGGIVGAAVTGVLWILDDLRTLFLESFRTSLNGYVTLLGKIPGLQGASTSLSHAISVLVDTWWIWVPLMSLISMALLVVIAYWLLGAILRRIDLASGWDPLIAATSSTTRTAPQDSSLPSRSPGDSSSFIIDEDEAASPLPVRVSHASFSYPGSQQPALSDVSVTINAGEFVVVEGPNGSGKSTLALLLAGAQPTAGTIEYGEGEARLGQYRGVAFVSQRSELQMLGETVADDVLWGLSAHERARVDLPAVLATVGLGGQEDALTRHLSGGQLQRLSLAGALVRRPSLLISDESTAMIDQQGRRELLDILASLPQSGTSVVHITHDVTETQRADRVIHVREGRIVSGETALVLANESENAPDPATPVPDPSNPQATERDTPDIPAPMPDAPTYRPPGEHLWANGVAHTYDVGTPWENPVLRDVTFILSPGQGLLITGGNGSGKTTLSRILTGLIEPTWGKCTLGSDPMTSRIGDVALSMQFARLQLQRPSVRSDILAAAGHGPAIGNGSEKDAVVGHDDAATQPRRFRRRGAAHRRRGRQSTRDAAVLPREQQDLIDRAMRSVGLDPDLATRSIDELSGGQMRRVALAGLLASDPQVLVLDEPMAGLDTQSRSLLIDVLAERRRQGLAVLVISHDTDGLDALCTDRMELTEGILR